MALLGVIEVALFTPLHETTHGTPFRSRALNVVVGKITGFLLVLPPVRFRYFHIAHHRHTQDLVGDPELAGVPALTRANYWLRLSGLPYWVGQCHALLANACGRANETWIPVDGRPRVVHEARAFLGAYALLGGVSIAAHSTLAVVFWILPVLLGQPALRWVLMAEHAGCPLGDDSYGNTRTTLTAAPVRLLFWNANYHAEHHLAPTIPFHALPALHELVRDRLGHVEAGYWSAHRGIRAALWGEARSHVIERD